MLGIQLIDAESLRGATQMIERRVAFTQRYCVAKTIQYGQQFAKAPYARVIQYFR